MDRTLVLSGPTSAGRCGFCGVALKRTVPSQMKTGFCTKMCEEGRRPKCEFRDCDFFMRYTTSGMKLCNGHIQQLKKGWILKPLHRRRSATTVGSRDELGNKMCSKCLSWKPESEFHAAPGSADGLHSYCKKCSNLISAVRRYGITLDRYQELLRDQGAQCPVCELDFSDDRAPAIDHDHRCCPGRYSCGKCVRGLLCNRCNPAIGLLDEDPERFARAVRYLTQ